MINRNGVIAPQSNNPHGHVLYSMLSPLSSPTPASTIERLVNLALDNNLDALWIAPGSVESMLASNPSTAHGMTTETADYAVQAHTEDGALTCINAWAKRQRNAHNPLRNTLNDPHRTIRIFFPEHDLRWDLADVTDPHELLAVVDAVEEGMGYPMNWGPGSTGKYVMKALNSDHVRAPWLRPVSFVGTPWLPTDGSAVPLSSDGTRKHLPEDVAVRHDMTADLYLHIYDKYYGYGGAMTSINCGAGQPQHYTGVVPWSSRFPGIWLVGNKWTYTPEVEYFIRQGLIVPGQIHEAWIWQEYHQTLRTYAERFWELEQKTKHNPRAKAIGKKIRSQGAGWLAMDIRQWRDDPELADVGDLYRPDLWGMTRSRMRTVMNYKINSLFDRGHEAVWWNYDELGFLSNERDPAYAVPIFDRSDAIGGFRHRYSLLVDADILAGLASGTTFADCHRLLLNRKAQQESAPEYQETMLVPAVEVV